MEPSSSLKYNYKHAGNSNVSTEEASNENDEGFLVYSYSMRERRDPQRYLVNALTKTCNEDELNQAEALKLKESGKSTKAMMAKIAI